MLLISGVYEISRSCGPLGLLREGGCGLSVYRCLGDMPYIIFVCLEMRWVSARLFSALRSSGELLEILCSAMSL